MDGSSDLQEHPMGIGDEPYARQGSSASQLEAILVSQADTLVGEVVAVAYAGRGGVLWHAGEVRVLGPASEEFKRVIAALLEDLHLESGEHVRDALLSMGGARLVVDRLTSR